MGDEFVHDGSLLAAAEMLRGGITCFNDMYFFPEATARAALRAGIRASLGIIAVEFPSAYAADAAGYLHKGLATRDAYRGEELLSLLPRPARALHRAPTRPSRSIATLAEEIDAPVHTHLHETADEIAQGLAQHGVRPLERLRRLGLVGPAAHRRARRPPRGGGDRAPGARRRERRPLPVLEPEARERHRAGGRAASPRASTWAWAPTARPATTGSTSWARCAPRPCSPRARAATPACSARTRPCAWPPSTARAPWAWSRRSARSCPGKSADLAAVELSSPETLPCFDPVSDLVYSAGREHVTHVWVAGRSPPRRPPARRRGRGRGPRTSAALWRQRIRMSP